MKRLIHEIHRRSLWQVLGIYLAGSWVALQVVEQLTTAAGLPDWVQPFALVLLVVGLPIVLGAAFVQVGVRGGTDAPRPEAHSGAPSDADPGRDSDAEVPSRRDEPGGIRPAAGVGRWLTWRNATFGAMTALAVLGLSVIGYFTMRATGVGPAASLVARGVIEEGDPILLADFENTSNDPALGGIVVEALRVDLSNGSTVTIVDPGRIRAALERMGRDPDEPLTAALAHEVAVRDGIKAVLEGEVGSAGSGYILVARIAAAESGTPLATFRRTARNADEIIAAIDGLSQDIREEAGESLRSIRADAPLEELTTSSLDALRKYTQAEVAEERGEHFEAKALLEEALELDPEFAMAWRRLAVATQDAGGTREEAIRASTRAYELRHRLTERERYLAIAYYHGQVTGDGDAQARAYRAVLERHPDDRTALNNLALVFADRRRYEEAIELLERAISGPGSTSSAFNNLVFYRASSGDVDGARRTLELISSRDVWYSLIRFQISMVAGEWEGAHAIGDELVALPDAPAGWRHLGRIMPGLADVARGRLAEALAHFDAAAEAARAAGRPEDVVDAALQATAAERLTDPSSGRARATLRRLLASGDVQAVAEAERNYGAIARGLVRAGLIDEARQTLEGWSAAGGLATGVGGTPIDRVRAEIEPLAAVAEDPATGAEALRVLRSQRDCPRCYASDIGRALERAGDIEGAIEEFEWSHAASEGNGLWFGARRVLTDERLGNLYDQLGDGERAAEHYGRFVEAWADADDELQPRVRAARARLEEILRDIG